mmetsp:Transcript_3562/g.9184  ORF Transcript_3562/g.9184 Transcript_3562/m.9184 type:complete len:221 (-) Transcript_3562:90-752(-)
MALHAREWVAHRHQSLTRHQRPKDSKPAASGRSLLRFGGAGRARRHAVTAARRRPGMAVRPEARRGRAVHAGGLRRPPAGCGRRGAGSQRVGLVSSADIRHLHGLLLPPCGGGGGGCNPCRSSQPGRACFRAQALGGGPAPPGGAQFRAGAKARPRGGAAVVGRGAEAAECGARGGAGGTGLVRLGQLGGGAQGALLGEGAARAAGEAPQLAQPQSHPGG